MEKSARRRLDCISRHLVLPTQANHGLQQILQSAPIYLVVKFVDGDGQKMGEIYERMDNMLGEIKDSMVSGIYAEHFPEVEEIVLRRWEKMNALSCICLNTDVL
ncbi:hypothetical protein ACE6H2_027061 [Prunus campanulata]